MKVKLKDQQTTYRLQLPVTVGSATANQIVINSPGLTDVAYAISATTDNKLQCKDLTANELVPINFLKNYRITVSGPYPSESLEKSPLARQLSELLVDERRVFANLPAVTRGLLGGFLPDKWRYLSLTSLAALLIISLIQASKSAPTVNDRSQDGISLEYGAYFQKSIGSSSTYRDFQNGFTVRVTIPESARELDHFFSFDLSGNDVAKEFSVYSGTQLVLETELRHECLSESCTFKGNIPPSMLSSGVLVLRFQHNQPQSDYTATNILIASVQEATPHDRAEVERLLAASARYYDERFISYLNINLALRYVKQAQQNLVGKSGLNELEVRAKILAKDVFKAREKSIQDLWFATQRNLRLEKYLQARENLGNIKKLLQQSDDPRMTTVSTLITNVESKLR